jgi:uncharacterized protein YecT (DUF1311 family)
MKSFIVISALLFGATAAVAALPGSPVAKRYTPMFAACMESGDAAEGNPAAIVGCRAEEIDRQNAVLNRKYVAVMRALPKPKKMSLRASERAWIIGRDKQCRDEMGEDTEGTLGQVVYTDCILDETIKRILWIERYR